MTLNLPLLCWFWFVEYCPTSPNKNKSPKLWHVTSILVCWIFWGRGQKSWKFADVLMDGPKRENKIQWTGKHLPHSPRYTYYKCMHNVSKTFMNSYQIYIFYRYWININQKVWKTYTYCEITKADLFEESHISLMSFYILFWRLCCCVTSNKKKNLEKM